eukprot:4705572-Karenia_brevis.AAC.1
MRAAHRQPQNGDLLAGLAPAFPKLEGLPLPTGLAFAARLFSLSFLATRLANLYLCRGRSCP